MFKRIGICFLLGCGFVVGFMLASPEAFAAEGAKAVAPASYKKPVLSSPRTTKTAELFSVEAGARCHIRFGEQDLITSVPFAHKAFRLVSAYPSDNLPRYAVTGFSFAGLPVEKVFLKLVKDAGIKVTAEKGPYPVVSGKDMKGELSQVLDKIADTAGIFYTYDDARKTLHIYRSEKFKLNVPESRPVMLSVLDALRGMGIKNIIVDWDKKSLIFSGTAVIRGKVEKLIEQFDSEPNIIAFDVRAYRITPRHARSFDWQKMVDTFGTNSIRSSVKGVMGRLIVTEDSGITDRSFLQFVNQYATVTPLSEGEFMVPDGWRSRFDIGRCSPVAIPESGLSLLMQAKVGSTGSFTGALALDTTKGEITNFPFYSSYIGDSLIVIGIPSGVLVEGAPRSEIALFITPKLIRILKEDGEKK